MNRNSPLVPVALCAAGLYAVTGVLGLAHPQEEVFETIDYVHEWVFVAALLLSAGVLATLARAGSGVGAWIGAAGNALLVPAAAATAIQGRETLDGLFLAGLLAMVVGYATLAVLDLRKRLVPAGLGLVLALGWIAAIPVDGLIGAGGLVMAATWAGVAHVAGRREALPRLAEPATS